MLITEAYRAQQAVLHERGNYGTASLKHAPLVIEIVNRLEIAELLDYGCGKMMNLAKAMRGKVPTLKTYQAYEPAVPELSDAPVPSQMVACIDVLEHIEPDLIDNVMDDLKRVTNVVLFATVHCGPAVKTLPDGRNAHLIQQPMTWWLPKFTERFDLQTAQVLGGGFYVIAYAKPREIESVDGEKLS